MRRCWLFMVAILTICSVDSAEASFSRRITNSYIIKTDGRVIRSWQYQRKDKPKPTGTKILQPCEQYGVASFYGDYFQWRPTASGEIFDKRGMTAAHRFLPLGTWVRVYYLDRYVDVKINDRGPYKDNRLIDLSESAFAKIAPLSRGLANVKLVVLKWPRDERKPFFA